MRQICDGYLGVSREVYMAFMDLEKAYDGINRNALLHILRIYGIGGSLRKVAQSFYSESRTCVRHERMVWC